MKNVYTVKQVNSYIKNMFTQDFMLSRIYVKGEISNCKYHTSGHIYFSLKDESGTIACVMFAGSRAGLSFRLQDGQQVIVLGAVSVYERDGKYQLYAREIVRDGVGALYERFEALKKELSEMGMFAPEYKQPIPRYVYTVGIVTAPTGAAVRDIINIAGRRNPYVQLILYPAQVQGDGAAQSVARGIRALEKKQVDVIIVGRGGGSIEDLWAFNEETVARAIFDCTGPIISAGGHETDTTIADFVADMRAPTPSAAAELAVCDVREVRERLLAYREALQRTIRFETEKRRKLLEHAALRLKLAHPRQRLNESRQYAADLDTKIRALMTERLTREQHRLALCVEKMKGLSPLLKLSQGYSYVQSEDGKNVKSIAQAEQGQCLDIYVTDGKIRAQVLAAEPLSYPGREMSGEERRREEK